MNKDLNCFIMSTPTAFYIPAAATAPDVSTVQAEVSTVGSNIASLRADLGSFKGPFDPTIQYKKGDSVTVPKHVFGPVLSTKTMFTNTTPVDYTNNVYDSGSYSQECGMQFKVNSFAGEGYITALRQYLVPDALPNGPRTYSLWSQTALLASITIPTAGMVAGWNTFSLATPVAVNTNASYAVSYRGSGTAILLYTSTGNNNSQVAELSVVSNSATKAGVSPFTSSASLAYGVGLDVLLTTYSVVSQPPITELYVANSTPALSQVPANNSAWTDTLGGFSDNGASFINTTQTVSAATSNGVGLTLVQRDNTGGATFSGKVSAPTMQASSYTMFAAASYNAPTSTITGNTMQILSFPLLQCAVTMRVAVNNQSGPAFAQSTEYNIPTTWSINSDWRRLIPKSNVSWNSTNCSGTDNTTSLLQVEFDICQRMDTRMSYIRMVRTVGTTPMISLISYTFTGVSNPTYSTAAGSMLTDTATYPYFNDASTFGNVTALGTARLNGGVMLPTTGGSSAMLDYYETYTLSSTFSGPGTTSAVNFKVVRVGSQVTLTMTSAAVSVAATSATMFTAATAVPPRFIPAAALISPIMVFNSSANATGVVLIGTDGYIKIYNGAQAPFTGSGNAGWSPFSCTYNV